MRRGIDPALISDRLAMAGHSYRAWSFLWMAFLNVYNKDLAYASKIAKRLGEGRDLVRENTLPLATPAPGAVGD